MADGSPNTQPAGVEVDGNAVRDLRKNLGYNLIAFAPMADVSFGYLSQIERGWRKRVSPAVFLRLVSALGIQGDPDAIKRKDAA